MNTTKIHIEHLLESRGIVAVPGMGTFVSRSVSSAISDTGVTAPTTSVTFENYGCAVCDDELCASISRALECDTTQAEAILAEDLETIRRELELDGHSYIGNLGRLSKEGASLGFEANAADSWLQTLDIEPLASQTTSTTIDTAVEQRREAFMRSLRRTASSAAAIAIFALIAFIFSQLPANDNGNRQVASIIDKPALPVQPISTSAQPEPSIVLIFNTPADASSPVESEPIAVAQLPKSDNDNYCLVVASLASRHDAEDYVRAYGTGYNILEKDGRYRVYTLSGKTFDSLNRAAKEAGEYTRHPNAWICRL